MSKYLQQGGSTFITPLKDGLRGEDYQAQL